MQEGYTTTDADQPVTGSMMGVQHASGIGSFIPQLSQTWNGFPPSGSKVVLAPVNPPVFMERNPDAVSVMQQVQSMTQQHCPHNTKDRVKYKHADCPTVSWWIVIFFSLMIVSTFFIPSFPTI